MSRGIRRGVIAASRRRSSLGPPVFFGLARSGHNITAATTSIPITVPAGVSSIHTGLIFVDADTNPSLTTPSGWTLLRTDDVGVNARTWIFTKALTAGDASASVPLTFGASTRPVASLVVFSGVTLTGIQSNVNPQTTATGTYTLPTLSSIPAGQLVIARFLRRRSGATGSITVPSPYTSNTGAEAATNIASGANTFQDGGYVLQTAGGTIGGEAGSTGVTSIGNNYLVTLPVG